MNVISQSMIIAEQLSDKYGDPHRYLESYLRARDDHGIMDSIKIALEEQNLLEIFASNCDPEVYQRYFS